MADIEKVTKDTISACVGEAIFPVSLHDTVYKTVYDVQSQLMMQIMYITHQHLELIPTTSLWHNQLMLPLHNE